MPVSDGFHFSARPVSRLAGHRAFRSSFGLRYEETMASKVCRLVASLFLILGASMPPDAIAEVSNNKIGFVLMHGKGGTPQKYISDLAGPLERQGFLVTNLEMPWSGRRSYDVTVRAAESEVESALNALRNQGAQKLFVAGLSQGGLFALHFGNAHAVDGIIAIAPGGNVASPVFREKLGESVELARRLVSEGKGEEKARFLDFESSRGTYPVVTTAAAYLTWFEPEGAMNQMKAVRGMNPATPVLYVVPTNDYPGLLRTKQQMFDALPKNPRTRLYEPESGHLGAPSASVRGIVEWAKAIANDR